METRTYHIVGIEHEPIAQEMLRDTLHLCNIRTHNMDNGDTFTLHQSHDAHDALHALLKMTFDDYTVISALVRS